jgi:hypothetical protein
VIDTANRSLEQNIKNPSRSAFAMIGRRHIPPESRANTK